MHRFAALLLCEADSCVKALPNRCSRRMTRYCGWNNNALGGTKVRFGDQGSAPSRHLVIKALMIAPDDSQSRIHFFDSANLSEPLSFHISSSFHPTQSLHRSSGSVIVAPAKRVAASRAVPELLQAHSLNKLIAIPFETTCPNDIMSSAGAF